MIQHFDDVKNAADFVAVTVTFASTVTTIIHPIVLLITGTYTLIRIGEWCFKKWRQIR